MTITRNPLDRDWEGQVENIDDRQRGMRRKLLKLRFKLEIYVFRGMDSFNYVGMHVFTQGALGQDAVPKQPWQKEG